MNSDYVRVVRFICLSGLCGLTFVLGADKPNSSRQRDNTVIARDRQLPSSKAKAFAAFVKEHVPYPIEVTLREGTKDGFSIIQFKGKDHVVFEVLRFTSVLTESLVAPDTLKIVPPPAEGGKEQKNVNKAAGLL